MIKAEKLTMEYARPLFSDVSFILGNSERVGLVGLNGCGKSTLMKIMAREEDPLAGEFHKGSEVIRYLPQEFDLAVDNNIDYLGEYTESLVDDPYSEIWKVERILGQLEFGEIDEFKHISTLSPGQKMKLYLTKLLLDEPTVLLLDEPTNHLDIIGITHFEKFLKKFNGICIIISHDREFLNSVTTDIFEIDEGMLKTYKGNYEAFLEQKQRAIEDRAEQFKMQERKREQLEALIEKARKISDAKKKSRAIEAAKKRLAREVTNKEIDLYKEQKLNKLDLAGSVHDRKRILKIEDLKFGYVEEQVILDGINLEVYGSEKIWIQGANGTGKSTLIKLLVGELASDSGELKWGENLDWVYFAQERLDEDSDITVQDYFFRETNVSWNSSFGVLDMFLFDKDLQNHPVRKLSPGQKARLTFAVFAQNEYQCLILDEPTNHLDIQTKEAIERALRDYSGAIILVSHDRYFSNAIEPSRILSIEGKRLVEK